VFFLCLVFSIVSAHEQFLDPAGSEIALRNNLGQLIHVPWQGKNQFSHCRHQCHMCEQCWNPKGSVRWIYLMYTECPNESKNHSGKILICDKFQHLEENLVFLYSVAQTDLLLNDLRDKMARNGNKSNNLVPTR